MACWYYWQTLNIHVVQQGSRIYFYSHRTQSIYTIQPYMYCTCCYCMRLTLVKMILKHIESGQLVMWFEICALAYFIDWRYSQSCWYIWPSFVNCCPSPTKYVHIKSTTVYAPRRNWDSPQPPTRRLVCPLPPVSGGRGTLAGEKGVGRIPIPTRGVHCGTLYMYCEERM